MNTTRLHPFAEDYLGRLEALAHALPPRDRHELLTELRSHLEAGLPEGTTDSDVRNLLDDLGSPEDIVAAAGADPEPHAWGALELIAVLGLTAGAVLLPVVGPLVGICLVWASVRWTRREKIVATVLTFLPLLALALGGVVSVSGSAHSGPADPVAPTPNIVQGVPS
jgi:hypothetical protein